MTTNNGGPVTTRDLSWADLVRKAWGAEFNAPDRGAYEFGGRKFDSTDKTNSGIYNGGITSPKDNPTP